ncbi:acetamidase/formamidase family protein [Paenibacillus alvei]|uniref:acetamidase/formamidase family protein n=1 Tax=Paenibacillus alvei TaxID=44250 RepID=UPI001EE64183|nr:acetamidase/formamidase family protein [Paenibacillus alvei]
MTSTVDARGWDYRGESVAGRGNPMTGPFYVEGALFHLGDGHAVQGCGEIVGTGLEISLDVRFTVQVLKGKTIGWPRGESDTHWFLHRQRQAA